MTLLYPLGLLGLLAIPLLIIIYVIKSKYTEQVIASTYLWTLSERFLKRRNPISRITGIISLILQIFAVIFISVGLAHPVFTLKGRADDYCFILDASGSMNIVENGSSRFEKGKAYIRDKVSSAAEGSTFTLIVTGETTDVLLRQSDDKKATLRQLELVNSSFVASPLSNATRVAQDYFTQNPACNFYLITDKTVNNPENVQLVKVGGDAVNRGIDGVSYTLGGDGSLTVTGKAYSYSGNANINVDLFIDGGSKSVATTKLELEENVGKAFTLKWQPAEGQSADFKSLLVKIRERDALSEDNSVMLYNEKADSSYKILIVSNAPFFLNAMFAAYGNMQREVITTDEYSVDKTGYGLYVFDTFAPESMPVDGAVWFINPPTGVDGTSGFSASLQGLDGNTTLTMNKNTSTKVRALLKDTTSSDSITVTEYVRCRLYRSFTTVMSCNGDPVIFAGSNSYGSREVVIGLNLHTSDFALSYNGRVIVRNLIDYTFPSLVDEQEGLYCGDTLTVNVLANCSAIRVERPSGKADYLDISGGICEYMLTEVGEYNIVAIIGNNRQTSKVYSLLPVAERIPASMENSFILAGQPSTQKRDGRFEDLLYAFIILAVIVVADWLVYCYEQYQLR